MINYYNIKRQLLLKALSLAKDRAGLVCVLRSKVHHKTNTPYTQHYWIKPDEVKATDTVVAGHGNLPAGHPLKLAHYSLTTKMSPQVKAVSDAYHATFNSDKDFFRTLKEYGISWVNYTKAGVKQSIIDGINIMRAKMRLNVAILAGWNPPGVSQSLIDAARASMSNVKAPPPQANPNNTKQATTPPKPQQSQSTSTSIQSVVINLPAKAAKASQAAKDKTKAFFKSLGVSKPEFVEIIRSMGIKWSEVANHAGINYMRAHEALSLHIENGFDVDAAYTALLDGQQPAPTDQVPDDTDVQSAPDPEPVPEKDESLLEVPDDATDAQKAIIEHINKMTDLTAIKHCAVMGIVPEDDIAQDYIVNTLIKSLQNWVENGERSDGLAIVAPKFRKAMAEQGFEVSDNINLHRGVGNSAKRVSALTDTIADIMITSGIKKNMVSNALYYFQMNGTTFTNPQSNFSLKRGAGNGFERSQIFAKMYEAFSDYTLPDDDYRIVNNGPNTLDTTGRMVSTNSGLWGHTPSNQTNLGYTGTDPEVYAQRYDKEKEGFVRYLRKLQSENPTDQALQDKVESMIQDYDEMMHIVGGNPNMLGVILDKEKWDDTNPSISSLDGSDFSRVNCCAESAGNAKWVINTLNKQSDLVISELKRRGYNNNEIQHALGNKWVNDDLRQFVVDKDDGTTDTIDFSSITDPNTGELILEPKESVWNNSSLVYTLYKFQTANGIDPESKEGSIYHYRFSGDQRYTKVLAYYRQLEAVSKITTEDFKRIKALSSKLLGFTMNNADKWDAANDQESDMTYQQDDIGAAGKCILTNVLLAVNEHIVHERICDQVDGNPRTNINDKGKDYSKNYDYYASGVMSHETRREKQKGNSYYNEQYTAQQISDKITEQLNNSMSFSAEYCAKVNEFYNKKSQKMHIPASLLAQEDMIDPSESLSKVMSNHNPMSDVMFKMASSVVSHVPSCTKAVNWQKNLAKRLKYTPANLDVTVDDTTSDNQSIVPDAVALKKARMDLFNNAMGTLATEDEQTSEAMRQDVIRRFDYQPGDKTPDGTIVYNKLHTGPNSRYGEQRALFNSRFFAVKNSIWEERFLNMRDSMISRGLDPKCYTPMDLFHGCSREAAGNILGRDKAWFTNGEIEMGGHMNGNGAYFGFTSGKSSVYVGDAPDKYASRARGPLRPGAADGCYMLCNVMRGERYNTDGSSSDYYTSSSEDIRPGLRDWEIVVRNNHLIFPHHIVDVSCRTIGRNVDRDKDGNYLDNSGNIAYDSTGKSVNMK